MVPSGTTTTHTGEFSGETAGAAEEDIGGPYGDGYANKSADGGVGEDRGMAMEAMQGAVEQLAKGQDIITMQIGLLIGAVALKQGQPVSSAPRVQPPEHKWVLETLDADEGSSEAQKQQEQIERARGLAKCKGSLPEFNRNPLTSSSRGGGIRAAIADVQDIATACGVDYLLQPPAESLQALIRIRITPRIYRAG